MQTLNNRLFSPTRANLATHLRKASTRSSSLNWKPATHHNEWYTYRGAFITQGGRVRSINEYFHNRIPVWGPTVGQTHRWAVGSNLAFRKHRLFDGSFGSYLLRYTVATQPGLIRTSRHNVTGQWFHWVDPHMYELAARSRTLHLLHEQGVGFTDLSGYHRTATNYVSETSGGHVVLPSVSGRIDYSEEAAPDPRRNVHGREHASVGGISYDETGVEARVAKVKAVSREVDAKEGWAQQF